MNRVALELLPDDVRAEWERMAFLHGVYELALATAAKEARGVEDPSEAVADYVGAATLHLIDQRPHYALRAFGFDALERLLDVIAPKSSA